VRLRAEQILGVEKDATPDVIKKALPQAGCEEPSRQGWRRSENMVHPLKVTLEQIMKGSARTLHLQTCDACGGNGMMYRQQEARASLSPCPPRGTCATRTLARTCARDRARRHLR
jgi:DnaJ-class molecular chaperone